MKRTIYTLIWLPLILTLSCLTIFANTTQVSSLRPIPNSSIPSPVNHDTTSDTRSIMLNILRIPDSVYRTTNDDLEIIKKYSALAVFTCHNYLFRIANSLQNIFQNLRPDAKPKNLHPVQTFVYDNCIRSIIESLRNELGINSDDAKSQNRHPVQSFIRENFLLPAIEKTQLRLAGIPELQNCTISYLDTIKYIVSQIGIDTEAPARSQPLLDIPLSTEIQYRILDEVCYGNARDFCILMAIAAKETGYNYKMRLGGYYGMYGIHRASNHRRMVRLGVTDLLDPVQSSMVALDLIHELMETLDTDDTITHRVLMSYNQGLDSADRTYESGVTSTYYSRIVTHDFEQFMSIINANST